MNQCTLLKLSIILLFYSVTSCKPSYQLSEQNYFINRTEFYNDSINLTGHFPGAIDYYSIKNLNKRELRVATKGFKWKNLLLYGRSIVGFDLFLFYQQNKNRYSQKEALILDTDNRIAFRKKHQDGLLTLLITKNEYAEPTDTKTRLMNNGRHILEKLKYEDSIQERLKYNQVIYKNLDISNILYIINKLDNATIAKSRINDWDKFQMLITMLSHDPTNKRFKELYAKYLKGTNKQGLTIDSILRNASFSVNENAIDQIRHLADKNKVVMLNECHWCPSHRIAALKLLSPLKEVGYKYLAIEALAESEEGLINQKLYPLKYSGIYTKEPYFGLFIREAKRLGFEIVSFDYGFSAHKNREHSQAKNIAKIFKRDRTAKVFVYSGGDHIIEKATSRKWMAEYFKELTNIDPLTIDQLLVITDTDDKVLLYESTVFNNIEGLNRSVDYFLINNIQPNLDEIFSDEDLYTHTINLEKEEDQEVFVSVFYLDEYENEGFKAVPILNRITEANILEIALPKNQKFKAIIFNKANQIISNQIISSKPQDYKNMDGAN